MQQLQFFLLGWLIIQNLIIGAQQVLPSVLLQLTQYDFSIVFFSSYSFFFFFQGGILSTWSFPSKEGPKFRKTTIMNIIL